jgi:hypothetical protein
MPGFLSGFEGEADMHPRVAWSASVANDPQATSVKLKFRGAAVLC